MGVVVTVYRQRGATGLSTCQGQQIRRKMNRTPKSGKERTCISTAPNRSNPRPGHEESQAQFAPMNHLYGNAGSGGVSAAIRAHDLLNPA